MTMIAKLGKRIFASVLSVIMLVAVLNISAFKTAAMDIEPQANDGEAMLEFGEFYCSWIDKLSEKGFEKTSKLLNIAGAAASWTMGGFEAAETIHSLLMLTGAIEDPTETKLRSIEIQLESISSQLTEIQESIEKVDQDVKKLYTQGVINNRITNAQNDLKAWADFETEYVNKLEEVNNEFKLKINAANKKWYNTKLDKEAITVYYRAAGEDEADKDDEIAVGDPIGTVVHFSEDGSSADEDIYGNSILSKYTFTIPQSYIWDAFTGCATYNVNKFDENVHQYLANSIKKAANDHNLVADSSFYTAWSTLTDQQKTDKASKLAVDALETVKYDIVSKYVSRLNDYDFISKVYTRMINFCDALSNKRFGFPAARYINYIYSNYGFEHEAKKTIDDFNLLISGWLVKYSLMAFTVVGGCDVVDEAQLSDMKTKIDYTSTYINQLYSQSLQNNSNYCYITNSNLKYDEYKASMKGGVSAEAWGRGFYLTYDSVDNIVVTQDTSNKILASDTDLALLNIIYQKYVARYQAQQKLINSPDYVEDSIPEDDILKPMNSLVDYLKANKVINVDNPQTNLVYKISAAHNYDPGDSILLYDALSYAISDSGDISGYKYISFRNMTTFTMTPYRGKFAGEKRSDFYTNYYSADNVKEAKRITASYYNITNDSMENDKTILAMQVGENHSKWWSYDEMSLLVAAQDYDCSVSKDEITHISIDAFCTYPFIYEYYAESNGAYPSGDDYLEGTDPFELYLDKYTIEDETDDIEEISRWNYENWDEYGREIDDLVEYSSSHQKIKESIETHINAAIEKSKDSGLLVKLTDQERTDIFNKMLAEYIRVESEIYNSDSLRATDVLGIYGNEELTRALIKELTNDASIPAQNAMAFNLYEPYVALEFVENNGKIENKITSYYNVEPHLFVKANDSDSVRFYRISNDILNKYNLKLDVYLPLEDNEAASKCEIKHYDDELFPSAVEAYEAAVLKNGDERYAKVTVSKCSPFTIKPISDSGDAGDDNNDRVVILLAIIAIAVVGITFVAKRKIIKGENL